MTGGTDFNFKLGLGGADSEAIPAGTGYNGLGVVLGMNVLLHVP